MACAAPGSPTPACSLLTHPPVHGLATPSHVSHEKGSLTYEMQVCHVYMAVSSSTHMLTGVLIQLTISSSELLL